MDSPVKLTNSQRDLLIWETHKEVKKLASKRELNINRGLIAGLYTGFLALGLKLMGVF